jgi:hypothetical protein
LEWNLVLHAPAAAKLHSSSLIGDNFLPARACCGQIGFGYVINGAHLIIYTKEPQADRAFFRDVLKFDSVDAGHDWLIFALPPLEAAFHPADKNGRHELYLMCDDIGSTLKELRAKNVKVSEPTEQRWGKLASLVLPGGGKLSLYEPAHPSPLKRKRRMPRKP